MKNKKEKAEEIINNYGEEGKLHGIRPKLSICIATNIIQKSLDIDFDRAASSIAPGDDIIQEIGRIHRHEVKGTIRENEDVPLKIIIYKPKEYGPLTSIYDEVVLDATCRVFKEFKSFDTVKDVRSIIDRIYDTSVIKQLKKKERSAEGKATTEILDSPDEEIAKNTDINGYAYSKYRNTTILTRDSGDSSVAIAIVPSEVLNEEEYEMAKKISREYVVSVRTYIANDLTKSNITNKFIPNVRIYESKNGMVRGERNILTITDLGLEIQKIEIQ